MGEVTTKQVIQRWVLVILSILTLLQVSPTSVQARNVDEKYKGDYDINLPISWHQSSAPYSENEWPYCTEGRYGPCSCGVHALASFLLKTGYWGVGKNAVDGNNFAEQHNIIRACVAPKNTGLCLKKSEEQQYDINNLPSNFTKGPTYEYEKIEEATGGYVKFIEKHRDGGKYLPNAKEIITDAYNNGYFAILSVDLRAKGEGHAIIIDYVDDNGDIIIVDSGGRYKYLDAMYGIKTIRIFEVPGLKAYDAPKLWLKEDLFEEGYADGANNSREDSGSSVNNTNGSGQNSGGSPLWEGELEDPFTWLDNPIVYYNEDDTEIKNTTGKGLSNNKSGWLDWLFE